MRKSTRYNSYSFLKKIWLVAAMLVCTFSTIAPAEVFAQQGSFASVYGEALNRQAAQVGDGVTEPFELPEIVFESDDSSAIAGGLVTCSGLDCDACKFAAMVNGIINWLFGIMAVLAVFILAIAGFRLVTSGGDTAQMKWAKDRIVYVFLGFLLMLASWLIVDTILRGLTGSEQGMEFWGSFDVDSCGFLTDPVPVDYDEFNVEFDAESLDGSASLPAVPGGGGSNCNVNESALVSIPGQGGHRATAAVAQRFLSVQSALAREGITVNVSSSYRSDARQTELWDGCTRCQAEGTVARPCSRGGNGSQHTSGRALDLVSSGSSSDIVSACRAAGASFTMTYERSSHVHCGW